MTRSPVISVILIPPDGLSPDSLRGVRGQTSAAQIVQPPSMATAWPEV